MEQQQDSTIATFCCYAHEDAKLLDELKSHLSPLQRLKTVKMWDDGEINAGTEWTPEIKKQLNDAQIILLLISADFINSEYCYGTEMKHALERHKRGEAKVVPIVLRPVSGWKNVPSGNIHLGELRALPTGTKPADTKPVTTWTNRDEAWENVARGIEDAINELLRGVAVPSVSNGQEQVSRCYQPIVSSPLKDAATSQGPTTQPDGSWGGRVKKRFIVIAIALALISGLAALVGNQLFKATFIQNPAQSGATITFNDLGGGSTIIRVYPGVDNTDQDKMSNGTYHSGDTVPIVCEKSGRHISSQLGEQYRQSDEWYKLQTPPGTQPEYATAVYADKHGSVPQC